VSKIKRHTLRLGLCCQFAREPIKFRTTTATALMRLPRADQLARLAVLCRLNADALLASLEFCARHGIGAFRINSQILPLKTHPQAGYDMSELPRGEDIMARFRACGAFAQERELRLSFHPDQFVVLNSPNPRTLAHSLAELNYQAEVAEWVGADSINIHGGGAYGDKTAALRTLRENVVSLRQRCVKGKTAPVTVRGRQLKRTNLCHERTSQRLTSTTSVTSWTVGASPHLPLDFLQPSGPLPRLWPLPTVSGRWREPCDWTTTN
jgi:UV DNA damage repair endonuclease